MLTKLGVTRAELQTMYNNSDARTLARVFNRSEYSIRMILKAEDIRKTDKKGPGQRPDKPNTPLYALTVEEIKTLKQQHGSIENIATHCGVSRGAFKSMLQHRGIKLGRTPRAPSAY